MFTGIVSSLAAVRHVIPNDGGLTLTVERPRDLGPVRDGDSIAINGVCLTVREPQDAQLVFDVVPETLTRSNLDGIKPGEMVNVEPSLRLGDRLGGHIVYGHVDATTKILRKDPEGQGYRLWCATPPDLERFIVEKGYIALDGVSLTVAETKGGKFAVVLIPETLKRTTFGRKDAGLSLNIEVDPVARYVAAQLEARTRA